jgi:hypothetical protein
MGKQNRQRRAAKQRKGRAGGRTTPPGTRPAGSAGPFGYSPFGDDPFGGAGSGPTRLSREERAWQQIDTYLMAAAVAGATGDKRDELDDLVAMIDEAGRSLGPDAVPGEVATQLEIAVHDAWHSGWQPTDLIQIMRRRRGDDAADLVALAILDEHARLDPATAVPPRWADQLDAVRDRVRVLTDRGCASARAHVAGAGTVGAVGVEARHAGLTIGATVLGTLRFLPALPMHGPEPCSWPVDAPGAAARRGTGGPDVADVDPAMLTKVRALLAKAESTTFEAEAMALTAKAQELMARHAIDRAVLDHEAGATDEPEARRVWMESPYPDQKSDLLATVADANRCQAVYAPSMGFSTIFGFGPDLDAVELLYTSLLVQASTAMLAQGSQRDARGRSRTRSFRQSFLVGFADRIGHRLRQATDEAVEEAAAAHGGSTALVPVLEARDEQVNEAVHAAFPGITLRRSRVAHAGGYHAGTQAAEQATLDLGQPLPR